MTLSSYVEKKLKVTGELVHIYIDMLEKLLKSNGCLESVEWNGGMEHWNGKPAGMSKLVL